MKTTKRRFICVLSVAALSATMLTVPAYSEEPIPAEPITVEGESSDPAYVDGHTPTGGTSWCKNEIPTKDDGSITALDFNVMMTNSKGVLSDDCIIKHEGGIKIEYRVNTESAGYYDMSISMAGYVEDTEAYSYYLPVKLKFDDNEEFRLACRGNGTYWNGGNDTVLQNQPAETIVKTGTVDVTGPGTSYENYQDHTGFYNVYKLLEPVNLDQGEHTITFILDMPPGHGFSGKTNSRGKFSLDKFVLAPASEISPTPTPADDDTIRVEGENYNTPADQDKWEFNTPGGRVSASDQLGDPKHTGMVLNSGTYDDNDKPSATYTLTVDKAGIYDLEYVANYLKNDAADKDYMYLSPFSVTLNGDQILFKDDTPNNDAMTSYKAPTKGAVLFGTYNLPVYLKEGENKITFTVEGKRFKGGDTYEFYLDYFKFTYNEDATKSDTIKAEAEELIAGNVPVGHIKELTYSGATDKKCYQFTAAQGASDGYLEYVIASPTEGKFRLELAGSNTDCEEDIKAYMGDYSIVINDDESSKISVGSEDKKSSGVTSDSHYLQGEVAYDKMYSNDPVTLKKGLNKVKVCLDGAAGNGNHVIVLDYLQFAPAIETSPTPIPTMPVYTGDEPIKVEGEDYATSSAWWDIHSPNVKPNVPPEDQTGNRKVLNLSSGKVSFDEKDKPYAAYTFKVEKAGIYDLEYVANYLKDETKDCMWLSPFSVTVNGDEVMFTGDTPNNAAITSYKAPSTSKNMFGTYKLPVYLDKGENNIKFTVEGGRYNGSEDYVFYLDYFAFTYNEDATKSDTVKAEAEELIAGNVPVVNIAQMSYDEATDKTYYRFTAGQNVSDGYLEYVIASPTEGKFRLELAGSNTDCEDNIKGYMGDYSIVINGDESSKISVGSPDKISSGVTSVSHNLIDGSGYDVMYSNVPVTLKKGLNKVKVRLDGAAGNGNHVIDLDYLKFTPAQDEEPSPTPTAPSGELEASDFTVSDNGIASAAISNNGSGPEAAAVISASYNQDGTLASVKLAQKTIGSGVTETVTTEALDKITSDVRAYVWSMYDHRPLNDSIVPTAD